VADENAATSGASGARRRFVLSTLAVFAVALVLALAAFAWVKVPDIYPVSTATDVTLLAAAESARSQAITTTRASVLAALAGLGALVTIAINYRNSRTAAQTLTVTNQTFRIQQRAHLTDRYTKAIEQLGNADSLAIRPGIYALEQIAVDTGRSSDQATVVEVLSAFFRTSVDQLRSTSGTSPNSSPLDAVSVLSRLPERAGIDRADLGTAAVNVNLTPALKRGADLTGVNLAGADRPHQRLPPRRRPHQRQPHRRRPRRRAWSSARSALPGPGESGRVASDQLAKRIAHRGLTPTRDGRSTGAGH
jgi:hypothetical protein